MSASGLGRAESFLQINLMKIIPIETLDSKFCKGSTDKKDSWITTVLSLKCHKATRENC